MNQQVTAHTYEHVRSYDTFLRKFKKNLIKEFISALVDIRRFFFFFLISIIGVMLFIFEFSFFKKILKIVMVPVGIFLIGKYALDSSSVPVILLVYTPIFSIAMYIFFENKILKGVVGFVGVSAFVSLFILCLI